MQDEFGRDRNSGSISLLKKHQNLLQDLSILQSQVKAIQEDGVKLQAARAGNGAGWRLQIYITRSKRNLFDNLLDKESSEIDEKYDLETIKMTS